MTLMESVRIRSHRRSKSKARSFFRLVYQVVMVVLGLSFLVAHAQAAQLPEFQTLDGRNVQLRTPAKRLLVYVWATWCTSCRDKLTEILPSWNRVKRAGNFDIITLNTERDLDKVKHYISKNELTLPTFFDQSRTIVREIRAFSVPHWAVYEQMAQAQWRLVDTSGGFDEDRVKRALGVKI
jgi:thiol-disulfide isomerase/thioredoxin